MYYSNEDYVKILKHLEIHLPAYLVTLYDRLDVEKWPALVQQ